MSNSQVSQQSSGARRWLFSLPVVTYAVGLFVLLMATTSGRDILWFTGAAVSPFTKSFSLCAIAAFLTRGPISDRLALLFGALYGYLIIAGAAMLVAIHSAGVD